MRGDKARQYRVLRMCLKLPVSYHYKFVEQAAATKSYEVSHPLRFRVSPTLAAV